MQKKIEAILNSLNAQYGRGTIYFITYRDADGCEVLTPTDAQNFHGEIWARCTNFNVTAKYKVVNGTVYFKRHQKKIG